MAHGGDKLRYYETLRDALLAEGFFERVCDSPDDTRALGAALGELVRRRREPGFGRLCGRLGTLALYGGVGAGKTVFSQGFARGLRVDAPVTSPTYVVGAAYDIPGGGMFHHFDAYRLSDPREMEETGFWDYLGDPDCVIAVEWAERLGDSLVGEPRVETAITRTGSGCGASSGASSDENADEGAEGTDISERGESSRHIRIALRGAE